ncbi:MAG: ATP-binding cassette domain-containing protein, partial [Actinomycetota bacterium]|nr:ATP-binding cassette domain-containing protein [Actinomycetota bacterium]
MTDTAVDKAGARTPTGGSSRLECRGLACGYGRLTVVRDVDLSLAPGEVLALLGPNGAGKTTLLHTIAGLLPRKGGEVFVDGGRLPSGRPATAVGAGVALVPDDRSLFMKLSVRENLEVARRRSGPRAADMLDIFP